MSMPDPFSSLQELWNEDVRKWHSIDFGDVDTQLIQAGGPFITGGHMRLWLHTLYFRSIPMPPRQWLYGILKIAAKLIAVSNVKTFVVYAIQQETSLLA